MTEAQWGAVLALAELDAENFGPLPQLIRADPDAWEAYAQCDDPVTQGVLIVLVS